MGFFDDISKGKTNKKITKKDSNQNQSNKVVTKDDILLDVEKYGSLLPKDIYEAVKGNPELMAEIITLLLKKKDLNEDSSDEKTLYNKKQTGRGSII